MRRTRSTSGSGQSRAWRNDPTASAHTSLSADGHGDRQVRPHADAARVPSFSLCLGRQVAFEFAITHHLVAAQPAQVPPQGLRVLGAHRGDPGAPPEVQRMDGVFLFGQFKHGRSVYVERLHKVLESGLDGVGQLVDGDIAESRGDVGGQALERLENTVDGSDDLVRHLGWRDHASLPQTGADNNMLRFLLTAYYEHRQSSRQRGSVCDCNSITTNRLPSHGIYNIRRSRCCRLLTSCNSEPKSAIAGPCGSSDWPVASIGSKHPI